MTETLAVPRRSGSSAEERIRTKAETLLRSRYPGARLVHELVMQQNGGRADLAAVLPDILVAAEIKSERDDFSRLPDQLKAMFRVSDRVHVFLAAEMASGLPSDALDHLWRAAVWIETEDGFRRHADFLRPSQNHLCHAADRLDMLWAEELKDIAGHRFGTRDVNIRAITDAMTGRQVALAVCRALRKRRFPRADPELRE